MFSSAPTDVIEIMRNEPVTANFHQFCLVESVSLKIPLLAKTELKI